MASKTNKVSASSAEPAANILANGALVTTDLAESCFLFASVYTFFRYVRKPNFGTLVICGLSVGFAWASKHSGVVVGPILVLLAGAETLLRKYGSTPGTAATPLSAAKSMRHFGLALVGIFAIGFVVLWGFYAFHFTARPNEASLIPTLDAYAGTLSSGTEAGLVQALAGAHILPESSLWGFTDVLIGAEGRVTFLLGKVYETGQWFYFLLVFLMKSTLGFLVLLATFPLVVFPIMALRPQMARKIFLLSRRRSLWLSAWPPARTLAFDTSCRFFQF